MSANERDESLWDEAPKFGRVYDKAQMEENFIGRIQWSNQISMKSYWSAKKETPVHELAFFATFLQKLQEVFNKVH